MCHKGYFRSFLQDKNSDIDITRWNSNVVNDEYKSNCFIPVDHDSRTSILYQISSILLMIHEPFLIHFL